jgi:hypothetical protein
MPKAAKRQSIGKELDPGQKITCFSCSQLSAEIIHLRGRDRKVGEAKNCLRRCPECGARVSALIWRNAG